MAISPIKHRIPTEINRAQTRGKKQMPIKWKEENYVRIYQLALEGHNGKSIAELLGVKYATYMIWRKKYPAIKKVIKEAKSSKSCKSRNEVEKFHEAYYQQLRPELRELWEEINACEQETNGIQRIEAIFEGRGDHVRQHLFLYALTAYNFNMNKACRSVGISHHTLNRWIEEDHRFPELLDDIHWYKKNYYENALIGLVQSGDTAAILFVNKTINRDRGYGEKVDVNVKGRIDHAHVHVNVDELDLPLETRKQILQAMREKETVVESNGQKLIESKV